MNGSAGEPRGRDDGVRWDGDAARFIVGSVRQMGAVEDRSVLVADCVTLLKRALQADALGLSGSATPERQARRNEDRADNSPSSHPTNRSETPSSLSLIAVTQA